MAASQWEVLRGQDTDLNIKRIVCPKIAFFCGTHKFKKLTKCSFVPYFFIVWTIPLNILLVIILVFNGVHLHVLI